MTSSTWQADLSRRPQTDDQGKPLWELLICDGTGSWQFTRRACQSEISGDWVGAQLAEAVALHHPPSSIQVFRPQSFSLIATGAQPLGITVAATRYTPQLKGILYHLSQGVNGWEPLEIEQLPPQPLPERLRGEQWQFAALAAGEVEYAFRDRPIPIVSAPDYALPKAQGLSSDLPVPGLVIYGGRASMALAQWLQSIGPVALDYMNGAPDGVILEAGLAERWVMATFEDQDVAAAGAIFQQRKQSSQGIHFLSVQPDDGGVTTSGFWLLRG